MLAGVPTEVAYNPTGADLVQLIRTGAAELPQTIVEKAAITRTVRMLLPVARSQRPRFVFRWLLAIGRDASIPVELAARGVPS